MSLTRLLTDKADILRAFIKRCNKDYAVTAHRDMGLFISDIQDHVVTMANNLNHFEKILVCSHSNYLNQMSIQEISQGNRANEFMRRVTITTTAILAMTVISGIFGMNVLVPWQNDENIYAFIGIVGTILIFGLSCLLIAKCRRSRRSVSIRRFDSRYAHH